MKKLIPLPPIPIPEVIYDVGKNATNAAIDQLIGNPATPDFSKFMNKVGAEDLSRPNLFLVRFGDFSTNIFADGVLDFFGQVTRDERSLFDTVWDFGVDKIREYGPGIAMNSELGKKLMGAYNPKLLKTILPGEFVDGILPSGFDINKDISMLVKAVNIPGTSFTTDKVYTDRKATPVVKGREINNITMTFYLRTNHVEREAMNSWMNMVQDPNTNEFGFYDSYARDIEIYPLDRTGVPLNVMKCIGCFPVNISDISYDTDNNNTIATFDVEFIVSTVQSKAFNGTSPFLDKAISIYDNVVTNPWLNKFF